MKSEGLLHLRGRHHVVGGRRGGLGPGEGLHAGEQSGEVLSLLAKLLDAHAQGLHLLVE